MLWLHSSLPEKNPSGSRRQHWGYGLPDQAYVPVRTPAIRAGAGPTRLQHLRGDITGGVAAAVLTIPISMGYGLLAFAPLGDAFVPQAILAGLYAPVFGCLMALLLRANTTMVYSPRSIITFLIGAFVLHSLARSEVPLLKDAPASTLLVVTLSVIFLAGAFQTVFGFLKLGSVIKYIPAPVIAGFQNAAAILIFLSQLPVLLGSGHALTAHDIPGGLRLIQWPALFVGVLTCALMLRGARITRRIPPTILGLIGGVVAYYLLRQAGFSDALGPVIGAIPFAWPDPRYFADFASMAMTPDIWKLAPTLIGGALSLAIVASLDGLLCARLVQTDSGQRVADNHELVRLGVGNMVSAGFGGLANGINLGSSFANHRSGGRTPLSVLVHALVVLLAIVVLSPLISYLPRVVIAGLLTAVSIQLLDRWTLHIVRNLAAREFSSARRMLTDLLVIVVVTVAAVALNIVLAVIIGTAVTILFFLFRMSKSVIRRAYRCDAVHSRKTREPRHMEILTAHGSRIIVLELEGPIFFGTAENLGAYIESALLHPTSCVILDFKRVNDIDSTGAKILLQIHDRLTKEGRFLLMSGLDEQKQVAGFLKDMGVASALTRQRLFHDIDRAIEWAEDHLILTQFPEGALDGEFPFSRLDVFTNMHEDELRVIQSGLERRVYGAGEIVFSEGDETKELYIIGQGSASVRLRLPGSRREARLITFSPGTVFGELALLDEEARSASVEADGELVCYVLSHAHFMAITRDHPLIAIKLLTNLGRELSGRLRRANRTIYQLAS